MTLSAEAQTQRRLWGADPEGWALFSEPHTRPLFEAVLDASGVDAATELLDIGCGTGLLLQLAAARGATVHGIDVTPGLAAIAQSRLPGADIVVDDLQVLQFADAAFDVVTAVNSFQFAADPVAAIAEAARVLRPGGRLGIGMFAEPERAESTAIHLAMTKLSPPHREGDHLPYALSAPGNLESAIAAAGLELAGGGEVVCVWAYDAADAIRGLVGSAGGTRAVEDVGAEAVKAAVAEALVQFTDPGGQIAMRNVFRWVLATKA